MLASTKSIIIKELKFTGTTCSNIGNIRCVVSADKIFEQSRIIANGLKKINTFFDDLDMSASSEQNIKQKRCIRRTKQIQKKLITRMRQILRMRQCPNNLLRTINITLD